jgi:hypothetical protein
MQHIKKILTNFKLLPVTIASVCVNEYGALMKRYRQGKTETKEENPVQLMFGPPQIPY